MADEWIVVRNWDTFQHYRDRTVPWIKFYAELLHDDAWLGLPVRTRSLLCGLWLLYMGSRCAVRADTRRLARALNQQVTRYDLELLNQAGFIEVASRPNLEHVQMASRPTRAREEEKRIDKEKGAPPTTPNGAAALPNKITPGLSVEALVTWVERTGLEFPPGGFEEELARIPTTDEAREAARARYQQLHPA